MKPSRSSSWLALAVDLAIAAPASAWAQVVGSPNRPPDQSGAAFLLIPVGARAVALGQAAVADAGSSEAAFWNPAGLAALDRGEVAVHYARTFVSTNTALSAYAGSRTLGTLGISAYLVDFGSQDAAGAPGVPTVGRLDPKNIELMASYATDIAGTVSVGVSYKLIQFRQDCTGTCGALRSLVGTTHGVDIGVQCAVGRNDALRLGVALQNAGFKLQVQNRDQADALPTRVQVGAIYRLSLPASAAGERLDARILMDVQNEWGQYANPDARVGVELGYGDVLKLRTGYAFLHAESSGPSLGLGLKLGRVMLDFARSFFESSSLDDPVYVSLRAAL